MPSEGPIAAGESRRLHPSSLLFGLGPVTRRAVLPAILALALFGRGNPEVWVVLLVFPAVVATVVRYASYRYRFDPDELVIREGIVTRNERHVPYARIQNIDLTQNLLHRLFRVAEVRVETAGGERPEAVIRVLSLDAVRQMRERVFAGRGTATAADAAEAAGHTLLDLPAREVALYGLISNRGMVVVAALVGAVMQFDPFERWGLSLAQQPWRELPLVVHLPDNPATTVLIVVVLIGIALVLLRLLSIALALARLHGFRLARRGEDLRAEYGLLTRISKTVPRHRVQLLTVREGPTHRLFDRAAVHVETAGGGGGEQESSADRVELAPLLRRERVPALVGEVLPEVDLAEIDWRPIAPGAWRRLLVRTLLLLAPLVVATAALAGRWALPAAAGLAALAWLHATLWVRHTGWALTEHAVLYRSGWWQRRLSVARFSKIQAVELHANPFDRRNRMASLRADTAGGGRTGHAVDVRWLEAPVAASLAERLALEAGRTAFRW